MRAQVHVEVGLLGEGVTAELTDIWPLVPARAGGRGGGDTDTISKGSSPLHSAHTPEAQPPDAGDQGPAETSCAEGGLGRCRQGKAHQPHPGSRRTRRLSPHPSARQTLLSLGCRHQSSSSPTPASAESVFQAHAPAWGKTTCAHLCLALMCICRPFRLEALCPHSSHTNSFSPRCLKASCSCSSVRDRKHLAQVGHYATDGARPW